MAAQKQDIELLPKEEWEKTPFGRLLKWALTAGRYIVITTELAVILAFFSRFKLDRDLTNLYEDIKQKQAIVESASGFENEFRFLQKRLTSINELEEERSAAEEVIGELALLIPFDVALNNIRVTNKEVSLTATALSEQGLASFLTNLKTSTKFDKLVLGNVSSGTEKGVGIQFELKSEFRQ